MMTKGGVKAPAVASRPIDHPAAQVGGRRAVRRRTATQAEPGPSALRRGRAADDFHCISTSGSDSPVPAAPGRSRTPTPAITPMDRRQADEAVVHVGEQGGQAMGRDEIERRGAPASGKACPKGRSVNRRVRIPSGKSPRKISGTTHHNRRKPWTSSATDTVHGAPPTRQHHYRPLPRESSSFAARPGGGCGCLPRAGHGNKHGRFVEPPRTTNGQPSGSGIRCPSEASLISGLFPRFDEAPGQRQPTLSFRKGSPPPWVKPVARPCFGLRRSPPYLALLIHWITPATILHYREGLCCSTAGPPGAGLQFDGGRPKLRSACRDGILPVSRPGMQAQAERLDAGVQRQQHHPAAGGAGHRPGDHRHRQRLAILASCSPPLLLPIVRNTYEGPAQCLAGAEGKLPPASA